MDSYYGGQYTEDGMPSQDQSYLHTNPMDVDYSAHDCETLFGSGSMHQSREQSQHETRRSSQTSIIPHANSANSRHNSRDSMAHMAGSNGMLPNANVNLYNASITNDTMAAMSQPTFNFDNHSTQSLGGFAQFTNIQNNYAAALLANQYHLQANAARLNMAMEMQNNFMQQQQQQHDITSQENIPMQMNFTDPTSGVVGSYSLIPQSSFNPALMMGALPSGYGSSVPTRANGSKASRHSSYGNGDYSSNGAQGERQSDQASEHRPTDVEQQYKSPGSSNPLASPSSNARMNKTLSPGDMSASSHHSRANGMHMNDQKLGQESRRSSSGETNVAALAQAQGQAQLYQQGQMPEQQRQNNQLQRPVNQPRQQAHLPQQFARHQSIEHNQHQSGDGPAGGDKAIVRQSQSYNPKSSVKQTFLNAYSSTGFDMLTVLMRIATRPNPEINIGAVDLSCAFVVCDANEHDFPIVYCSENFERLTGYTKFEILGRNCRFLQAPDGKVQSGIKRQYVDDDAVLYLKNTITQEREAQISLINYRKGGQPFMNLLTTIPIPYDTDEIKFFVGFQVDLVEQPNSITDKNPDGTYTINYQRGLSMPRYLFATPEQRNPLGDSGQTISSDEVSAVLSTIGTGESDLSKQMWDKVLLENTDDVICVLSLKGLFMYLSPSCKKILEYEASELMGTALSSICHPSDIVPVTRELKDMSTTAAVSVVLRIRRKHSGYVWFEGHGALHTEQGKGRKSIVLIGRERPVYTLSKRELAAAGGIGDNEVWTKLSTSGMFLFVSSNIRSMLERTPDELVGTSIQALMRQESKQDFNRVLELARHGKWQSTKHDLLSKRGQVLQAYSTVFPGDASEGSKPTFVIAQTRLLKYSRPVMHRSLSKGCENELPTVISLDGVVPQRYISKHDIAATHAGQHGLAIGRQDEALASDENLFDELKTTRSTSWQFELRQMEKRNRLLGEELQGLSAARKKRKRRKGTGAAEKECVNCHTRLTPEWRKGPSGKRDLCNSCGLRWAKQQGRISPRTPSQRSQHSAQSDQANNGGASSARPPPQKMLNRGQQHEGSQQAGDVAVSGNPVVEGTLAAARQAAHAQDQRKRSRDEAAAATEPSASPDEVEVGGSYPSRIEEGEEGEEEAAEAEQLSSNRNASSMPDGPKLSISPEKSL